MPSAAREHLLDIFNAGLAAADPDAAVRRALRIEGDTLLCGGARVPLAEVGDVILLGAGKASAVMARAVEALLGDRVTRGCVNVKTGHGVPLRRVRVHEAGHPTPDEAGVAGAREIARLAREAGPRDLVIFCISGGGSALMPLPVEGVTLAEKQALTRELLACGADIGEVNCVRKHVSQLKGGQLARLAHPARVLALILSDVIGDPLDVIASGPTAPDPATHADALAVLRKYGIESRAPEAALAHLRAGAAGQRPDTLKPGDPLFRNVTNVIVAGNALSVEAARRRAGELGYRPLVLTSCLEGEAREAARVLVAMARECLERGAPATPPACLICGGETTVTLRGQGRGGRNQEFALAAALAGRGLAGWSALAAGTDGTDGPTDAAGAFADGDTVARALSLGLDPLAALANNDSHPFFDRLGDLLRTGPTGTNVMDLYLFTVGAPEARS
jgi:hydroxypyruvate reductase